MPIAHRRLRHLRDQCLRVAQQQMQNQSGAVDSSFMTAAFSRKPSPALCTTADPLAGRHLSQYSGSGVRTLCTLQRCWFLVFFPLFFLGSHDYIEPIASAMFDGAHTREINDGEVIDRQFVLPLIVRRT